MSIVLLAATVVGQYWTGPFQLTQDSAIDVAPSLCQDWVLADNCCLVWLRYEGNNWNVLSREYCGEWFPEERVTDHPEDDVSPRLAGTEGDPYLGSFWCIWERWHGSDSASIMVAFKEPRGEWHDPERVGACRGVPGNPDIAAFGGYSPLSGQVWAAWLTSDSAAYEIHYAVHDRDSWTEPAVAVRDSVVLRHARIGRGFIPSIGQYPLLAWERTGDIYHSEYRSGQWTPPAEVAPLDSFDRNPEVLSCSGDGLGYGPWISWESNREGRWAVFGTRHDTFSLCNRWSDSLADADCLNPTGTPVDFPVAEWDARVVVFETQREGNWDVFSRFLFGPDVIVDTCSAEDRSPTVSAFGFTWVWCCWQSPRSGNWDIYGSYVYGSGLTGEPDRVSPDVRQTSTVLRSRALAPGSRILDIQGRDVTEKKDRLSPGIYFLRSAESGERTAVRKVVIQH